MKKIKIKKKNTNSNNDFMYYPTLDDENFYKKIYSKKEFHQNIIPKETKTIEELCNPSEFTLLPQQKFLKNYISIETPYNGVLIFHGVGSGKTCTAITIAEQFKEHMKKYKKKILVILKRKIQKNFIKNIFDLNKEMEKTRKDEHVQCTGDTYALSEEDKYLTRDQKLRKIRASIKKNYQFIGYEQFANEVLRKIDWDGDINSLTPEIVKKIRKEYSNRIIIVDEVHHINVKTTTEVKKVPPILMIIIKYAKNIRLILMSATPMYDKPEEIIFLLNILLLNDGREPIKITDVFDKKGNIKEGGDEILRRVSKGYVSYLRGENPITFPIKLYPPEAVVPKLKYDINGNPLKPEEMLRYLKLILCRMSDYQYQWYKKLLKKSEDINERENEDIIEEDYPFNENASVNDEISEDVSEKNVILRNLIWISNIIYPTRDGNISVAKEGITSSDNGEGAFYRVVQTIDKRKRIIYRYQSHVIFDKGTKNEEPFLQKNKVRKYSDKFYTILNNVIECHGIVFVYSRYLPGGLIPLALMFEQNGIQRFEADGDKQLLDYHANKVGGGGKSRPICYYCGHDISYALHKPTNPNYHKFYAAKYMLLTGDINLTKMDIGKANDIINNKNNIYGQQVKIILGNEAISEGLDFHRIRQVHVVEPWYNISSLEQITGRAIRNCSHKTLKQDERNVEVFYYASVPPKNASEKEKLTETIDERNYRLSEIKDVKIKNTERILKESAVDCTLNKKGNIFVEDKEINLVTGSGKKMRYKVGDKSYSRSCDYKEKCNYKCNWEPPKNKPIKINDDTYNIIFAKSDIEQAKRDIKNLYKKNIIYDLKNIEDYVKKKMPTIEKNFIYKALDELVRNKEAVYDKYNREGYLIYRGKYYVFQPKEIDDKKIPLYYRETPIATKTKAVPIVGHTIEPEELEEENRDIIGNIKNNMEKIGKILENSLKENNVNINDSFEIILGMVLDRMKENDIVKLLKKLINKNNRNDLDNRIEKAILEYYFENLFSNNLISDRKRISNDILGFKFHDKYYCVKGTAWSICSEDIRRKIELLERLREKKKIQRKVNDIVGLVTYDKKGDVVFQIVDKTKYIEALTVTARKSKRSEITGRVCDTYKLEQLSKIRNELRIKKTVFRAKKQMLCIEIEFFFRLRDMEDKNKIWFEDAIKK